MKCRGSVTVFLALVITCCSALICALTESARTAGAGFYARTMTNAAMDSLFSQYHLPLWNRYRLIAYEYSDEQNLTRNLENFMRPYVENCGWYALSAPLAKIDKKTFLTDEGGVWFEQEVNDYLSYGWLPLSLTPLSAEILKKNVQEANTMDEILKDYALQSRTAVSMEKALSEIQKNVKAQAELKREARALIRNGENRPFQEKAEKLEHLVLSLPSLIKNYDKKAEAFSTSLSTIRSKHAEKWSDLTEENKKAMEAQVETSHAYADKDGVRRREINALIDHNPAELEAISHVRAFADETEAHIEAAEDEDGADEVDEDSLWASVANAWDLVPLPSCPNEPGIRDEKMENLLEGILNLLSNGYLHIVLPADREIPLNQIDTTTFPSSDPAVSKTDPETKLLRAIAVNEYAGEYLPSFTDRAEVPVSCQLEYVIGGKDSDKKNLTAATTEIFALREALNFIHIMKSPVLKKQVRETAGLIASVSAFPELSILLECLIMTAWASVESLMDLRLLLSGKTVPLSKSEDDWMISMSDALIFASSCKLPSENLKSPKSGLSYEAYLKSLLLTKSGEIKNYRIMDMIQANLMWEDPSFRMKNCLYGLKTSVSCESGHLFTGLSAARQPGDGLPALSPAFPIQIESVKAY